MLPRLILLVVIIGTVSGDSTNTTAIDEDFIRQTLKNFDQESFDQLTSKVGTNWTNQNQETLLHIAAEFGYFNASEALIKQDPKLVNATDRDHWYPLHKAAWHGNCDIISLLLNNSADVNALARYTRETPTAPLSVSSFYLSIRAGHIACAKLLLNKGVNINQQDHHGWAPLHEASRGKNYEIVKMLIEKGVDINIKNEYDETALEIAKLYKADEQIIRCLQTQTCPNN